MRRGASPIISSTLLILVGVAMATIFYVWATTSTSTVVGAISIDADHARREILSDVTILTPPPLNAVSTQPVIIHNSGSTTLTRVSITYIKPDGSSHMIQNGTKISVDGTSTSISNWPLQQLNPGEAIIIWLPQDDYSGYTIIFTSYGYTTSKTIGVP